MSVVEAIPPDRLLEPAAWARCIVSLPSLPSAFIAAVELLSNDDASAASCIAAIERDQALTVRVLRLANSAFYGAPGQVSRIGDAVQMLGLRTVASTPPPPYAEHCACASSYVTPKGAATAYLVTVSCWSVNVSHWLPVNPASHAHTPQLGQ